MLHPRESSAPPRGPSPTRRDSAIPLSRTTRRLASRARNGAAAPAACGRSNRRRMNPRSDRGPGSQARRTWRLIYDRTGLNYIKNCFCYTRAASMTSAASPQHQQGQSDADVIVRLGGWLFQRRTWLPFPFVLALLLIPSDEPRRVLFLTGVVF